jgi:hypothetical protein
MKSTESATYMTRTTAKIYLMIHFYHRTRDRSWPGRTPWCKRPCQTGWRQNSVSREDASSVWNAVGIRASWDLTGRRPSWHRIC